MQKISIITPNYNGEQLLKKNILFSLEAIQAYKKKSNTIFEFIVIDDGSKDNSLEILEQFKKAYAHDGFTYIKNKKNLGFSPTINKAVKYATGDIVILLNSDVRVEKDFLTPLLKHFENTDVFAVGCLDESIEHGETIQRGRGVGKWQRGFLIHAAGELTKKNTLWVSGGSGAFRKSVWEHLGGFIELYAPFYWEDIDLSYRALKSGYKIYFEPKSIVIHEHEQGAIKKQFNNDRIATISYRNQILFTWINATDRSILVQHMLWLPYFLFRSVISGDGAFLKGFFKAVLLLPKVVPIRKRIQKINKRTDAQVIHATSG